MAGIIENIKEKLHMGGGTAAADHKDSKDDHKKVDTKDAHKKDSHSSSGAGEHKEGILEKVKDKVHGGEGGEKKSKDKKKKKEKKKHGDGHESSSSSDSD